MHEAVTYLIKNKLIASAHDITEGGLFVNLMECSFFKELGFDVAQKNDSIRSDAWWFGEAQGRVVVSVKKDKIADFEDILDIPFQKIGEVTSGSISINNEDWGNVAGWKKKYDEAIGNYMKK